MRHLFLLAGALAMTSLPAIGADESVWRLFVGDHQAPVVSAIDLATGAAVGRFTLDGPARLHATSSQGAVFAVQTDAGKVAAIETGIRLSDHGDHGDVAVDEPKLVTAEVAGDRPVHFVEHGGDIAIFFDGSGSAGLLRESAWLAGDSATRTIQTAAPHHGVAVALGARALVSVPHPDDPERLPVGLQVVNAEGSEMGPLHACPDLHGEATSGDLLAVACAEGLLLVGTAAREPEIRFLAYADDLPEVKTTTLLGGVGLQYFLGNYGADGLVIIDPAAQAPFRLIKLPTRRVDFAVNRQQVKFAYVFTEDGQLREVDVLSGELTRALRVTEPYSMDGEWSLPRPRIAVAAGKIAVTDPLEGVIRIVDAGSFTLERELAVGGSPYSIVAVGGSGESHEAR
jgi:hypothetical protein